MKKNFLPLTIYRHSDDLGITEQNCMVILDAWENGYINGFSIIANPATHDYLKKRLTNISIPARIAVHLNLNDGKPLSPKERVNKLTNPDGYLDVSFTRALLKTVFGISKKEFLKQVETEWRAQIEKVKECTGSHSLTFLDGHYHIHMIPSLFKIATNLCIEYHIPQIRVSREFFYVPSLKKIFSSQFFLNTIKHITLNLLSSFNKLPKEVTSSADYIAGILSGSNMTTDIVKKIIRKAKKKNIDSLEIIYHIGVTDKMNLQQWTMNRKTIKHYSSGAPAKELSTVNHLYE